MSDNTTTGRLKTRYTGENTNPLGCRGDSDTGKHLGTEGAAVIETRKFMQERTVLAIMAAAATFGAVVCPVFRKGRVDEVHLFRGGQLRASIFSPAEGRVGIWRVDGSEAVANTPFQAVQRALDPLRKNTHARLAA
jgi:hypothetical protein